MTDELARIKEAMKEGTHTDGDLAWCVEEVERLKAVEKAARELLESFGDWDANLIACCSPSKEITAKRIKDLKTMTLDTPACEEVT